MVKEALECKAKKVFNCGEYNKGSEVNQRTANEVKDSVKVPENTNIKIETKEDTSILIYIVTVASKIVFIKLYSIRKRNWTGFIKPEALT